MPRIMPVSDEVSLNPAVFPEITIPTAFPAADSAYLYGKDNGGVTNPYWMDENGTESALIGFGSAITEVAGNLHLNLPSEFTSGDVTVSGGDLITSGGGINMTGGPLRYSAGNGNQATNGDFRFGNTDTLQFRNAANGANIVALTVSATDLITLGDATHGVSSLFTIRAANKIWPGTDAGAIQTAIGLYAGTGVPDNANGVNGDIYFRSDGAALSTVYQRRAGAWVGIV